MQIGCLFKRYPMIPIEDFKNALGFSNKSLTEEQIETMRKKMDTLANTFFDILLKKRNNQLNGVDGKK